MQEDDTEETELEAETPDDFDVDEKLAQALDSAHEDESPKTNDDLFGLDGLGNKPDQPLPFSDDMAI